MKNPHWLLIGSLLFLCGATFAPPPSIFPASAKPFKIEIAPLPLAAPARAPSLKGKTRPLSELELRLRAGRLLSASA